jgi:MFS family permease
MGERERVLSGVAAVARFGAASLAGTALPTFVEATGGSAFAVGLLGTAYFLGMTMFAPTWGAVADVTGRRRTVLVGTGAGATAALSLLFLAGGPASFIAAHGLHAVFGAGFAPVMLAVVSERGGAEARGEALGLFNSARALGFVSGRVVAGFLLGAVAPASLYGVMVGGSLLATGVVAFAVSPTGGAGGDLLPEIRRRLLPAPEDRHYFRRSGLGWLYVALALRNVTVVGTMVLMPVYLTRELGLPDLWMGLVLAVNPAAQMAFMIAFGRAADARGRKPLIVAGMAGSGAFALLAGVATVPTAPLARLAVVAAAMVVLSAAFSAMTAGALAFIGDVAPPDRESSLMGLRSTAKGVGGVVGPAAFGSVAAVTSYAAAILAGSLLAVGAAVLAWRRLEEPDVTGA